MKKIKNQKLLKKTEKTKKIINLYKKIKNIKNNIKEIKNLYKKEENIEEEMKELIKDEIYENKKKIKILKKIIKKEKKKKIEKINLEIKIGVGGEESAIFISDLKKMYEKYIEKKKWKKKIISKNITKLGGYKELIIKIKGKNIYKNLKYESGVHRVQRSPKTENKGKIHTSTCRVCIYKNIKKNKIILKKSDLKIETFKSSGAGGQHVNKTNSAVRIRHIPTNTVVECQKERSQHKNKKYALESIKKKIIKEKNKRILENKRNVKSNLLGKGNRVEKIRTYNYKENRITDHRFKINFNLNLIMEGNLDIIIKKIKNKKNKNNIKIY